MNYGYVYDPDKIAAAKERMTSAGFATSFDADRPKLKGYWDARKSRGVTMVLAQVDELKATGVNRPSNEQRRGTCVGQGSGRSIVDKLNSMIADKSIICEPTDIADEVMYGYQRKKRWRQTHPWGCQCGNCPDGLTGQDAAEHFSMQGVVPRGIYGGVDLSKPNEQLAITWNNIGVPSNLLEVASNHKIICHASQTWDEYADAIAAKHWGWVCLPGIFQAQSVDEFGCCRRDGNGGHCTECCGIVVLPNGESAFIMQQSWGNAIRYPRTIQTASGPLELRQGSYAVRQSELERMGQQVERHSCDIPTSSAF